MQGIECNTDHILATETLLERGRQSLIRHHQG